MSNFLHLALRLSLIQTILPAFSPFCPISKLPLLIKSHAAILSDSWVPNITLDWKVSLSPSLTISLSPTHPPSYRALLSRSSLVISLYTELFVYSIH